MNKGLEAYKKFCDDVIASVNSGGIHYIDIRNKEIVEKELKEGENYKAMYRLEHEKNQQLSQANLKMSKALEIIKNKNINIEMIKLSKDYFEYDVSTYKRDILTQEEYNLLKEVLL